MNTLFQYLNNKFKNNLSNYNSTVRKISSDNINDLVSNAKTLEKLNDEIKRIVGDIYTECSEDEIYSFLIDNKQLLLSNRSWIYSLESASNYTRKFTLDFVTKVKTISYSFNLVSKN